MRKHASAMLFAGLASIINPAAAADLRALLDGASPGDVIETDATDFGVVSLRNYEFAPAVTIRFHADAQIETLTLRDISGVHFENMTVRAGATTRPTSAKAIYIQRGGDIAFRNIDTAWSEDDDVLNDGTGIFADTVNGISVEDSNFDHARNGVVLVDATSATVRGSRFSNILADGIGVSGTTDALIEHNICIDFADRGDTGVHPDCVQIRVGSRLTANRNVLITNNIAVQGDGGHAQGVHIKSKYAGIPHENITVENNFISQGAPLGIYGENVSGLIIRNNLVTSPTGADYPGRILVRDPSSDVTIENNIAWRVTAPAHAAMQNNTNLEDETD